MNFSPPHQPADPRPGSDIPPDVSAPDDITLAVHNLGKSYGARQVVKDVSLYVQRGEAVGSALPAFAKLARRERAILIDQAHAQPHHCRCWNEQHQNERQDQAP